MRSDPAARSFRSGRQEDAHEYLVGLLDAMHEGVLAGLHPRPPRETAETSFIYRIFGGRLRSQARRRPPLLVPRQIKLVARLPSAVSPPRCFTSVLRLFAALQLAWASLHVRVHARHRSCSMVKRSAYVQHELE